ncbi:MAG: hypothetical protein ACFCD0_25110 [Gemmataceae bacterium]
MKAVRTIGGVALLLAIAPTIQAEQIKSGVPVGKGVSSYSTTKIAGCAGATDDRVKIGANLCYT